LTGCAKVGHAAAEFRERPTVQAASADCAKLEPEIAWLVEQFKVMEPQKLILFGSLGRGKLSLQALLIKP